MQIDTLPRPYAMFPSDEWVGYVLEKLFKVIVEIGADKLHKEWNKRKNKQRKLKELGDTLFGPYLAHREWSFQPPTYGHFKLNKPPYPNADKALATVVKFLANYHKRPLLGRRKIQHPSYGSNMVLVGSSASNPYTYFLYNILRREFNLYVDDRDPDEDKNYIIYMKENGQDWRTKQHAMICDGKVLVADLESGKDIGYDYLRISRLPNLLDPWSRKNEKDVFEVCGVQSIGTGGAHLLFRNEDWLDELYNEVRKENARYYQALFRVEVFPGDIEAKKPLKYGKLELEKFYSYTNKVN